MDVEFRLDPNGAPWWELTILPGIGPALARRIEKHRNGISDNRPVFQSEHDLDAVTGIGPRTITRIAPYLRFAEPERLSRSPVSVDQNRDAQ